MTADAGAGSRQRHEELREATTMVLYVAVVLLAALVAIPREEGDRVAVGGAHTTSLLALVWGTTVGLAVAHWFAFRLATALLGGGRSSRGELRVAVAQVAGALLVAAVATVAVFLVPSESEASAASLAAAAFVALAGAGAARAAGRPWVVSIAIAGVVLALGVTVALVKASLGGH